MVRSKRSRFLMQLPDAEVFGHAGRAVDLCREGVRRKLIALESEEQQAEQAEQGDCVIIDF